MKLFTIVTLLHVNAAVYCLCNNSVDIPDIRFKNALLNHSPIIDSNHDGEISILEAERYTGYISIERYSITDLTGIEAFVNLTKLNCICNNITHLNLSSNLALIELYCSGNKLRSLNLSRNTALTILFCSTNYLTALDVSHNTLLKELYCFNNNLTNLDLSYNTSLTRLSCNQNQLTFLNLANGNNRNLKNNLLNNNSRLRCIKIDSDFTPPNNWIKDDTASYSNSCII